MSTGVFTALTPQNRPLDFQKTLSIFRFIDSGSWFYSWGSIVIAQFLQIVPFERRFQNPLPNGFGIGFGNDFIFAPQLENEGIRVGDIPAGRCPIHYGEGAQSSVDRGGRRSDLYIGRFLGAF